MSRAPSSPRTDRAVAREVAASVDAPPALAPVFAALFDGLDALGGMPVATANLLARAGLPRNPKILELACGKGTTAVELARRLGARVLALDAYEPFLDHARDLAARRGVAHLCTFRRADIHNPRALPRTRTFDAALMIGLDPIDTAAPLLRRFIRKGGMYLIDDAIREDTPAAARAYPLIPTRADAARFIEHDLNDEILATWVPTPAAIRRLNASLYQPLAQRVRQLRRAHPNLSKPLADFLARQRRANTILSGPVRPTIWVIRRTH